MRRGIPHCAPFKIVEKELSRRLELKNYYFLIKITLTNFSKETPTHWLLCCQSAPDLDLLSEGKKFETLEREIEKERERDRVLQTDDEISYKIASVGSAVAGAAAAAA